MALHKARDLTNIYCGIWDYGPIVLSNASTILSLPAYASGVCSVPRLANRPLQAVTEPSQSTA